MKTPDALLDDGAALLDRDGWVQGVLQGAGGRCALGGIFSASEAHGLYANPRALLRPAVSVAVTALANFIEPHDKYRDSGAIVATWNNWPTRTKEEVTTAMRAVAAQLRAEREAAEGINRAAREPETCE